MYKYSTCVAEEKLEQNSRGQFELFKWYQSGVAQANLHMQTRPSYATPTISVAYLGG